MFVEKNERKTKINEENEKYVGSKNKLKIKSWG